MLVQIMQMVQLVQESWEKMRNGGWVGTSRQDVLVPIAKSDLLLIAKTDADSQNITVPMNPHLTMTWLLVVIFQLAINIYAVYAALFWINLFTFGLLCNMRSLSVQLWSRQ